MRRTAATRGRSRADLETINEATGAGPLPSRADLKGIHNAKSRGAACATTPKCGCGRPSSNAKSRQNETWCGRCTVYRPVGPDETVVYSVSIHDSDDEWVDTMSVATDDESVAIRMAEAKYPGHLMTASRCVLTAYDMQRSGNILEAE